MPNTPEAMQDVAEEFEAMYGFPQLLGCIDGTLVKIQTPTQDEHIFVDRKGNHSINCQIICDSHMRILDVVARWPGSVHDGGIFEVSQMKHRFDNHVFGDYKLLGDSGYRLSRYLLTIYRPAITASQQIYNQLHKSTRCVVERCVGLLKGRWRCLHSTGGNLIYTPGKVCRMFLACSILHNICFMTEDGGLEDIDEDLIIIDDVDEQVNNALPAGVAHDLRNNFLNAHPAFHPAFYNL
ncbi:putative nuclease HARBI1 [Bemisia tabaci]|uniref:putative nuclease HARBI1 n=1 Tax=Bemisia tabaci TaxID=7038 RepID=UPI003B27DF13